MFISYWIFFPAAISDDVELEASLYLGHIFFCNWRFMNGLMEKWKKNYSKYDNIRFHNVCQYLKKKKNWCGKTRFFLFGFELFTSDLKGKSELWLKMKMTMVSNALVLKTFWSRLKKCWCNFQDYFWNLKFKLISYVNFCDWQLIVKMECRQLQTGRKRLDELTHDLYR